MDFCEAKSDDGQEGPKLKIERKDPEESPSNIISANQKTPELRKAKAERLTGEISKLKSANDVFGGLPEFSFLLYHRYGLSNVYSPDINHYKEIIAEGIKREGQKLGKKQAKEAKIIAKSIMQFNGNELDLSILVLNHYISETFLYRHINKLLREEKWEELTNLAPFIHASFYAFISPELKKSLPNNGEVYRGALFSQQDLSQYDVAKNPYFSWNSFTSASRDNNVAEFYGEILKEKEEEEEKDDSKKNTITHFTIFWKGLRNAKSGPLYQMVDAETFSQYSSEKEVMFAPGSIFKMHKKEIKDGKAFITLEHLCNGMEIVDNIRKNDMAFKREINFMQFKQDFISKSKEIKLIDAHILHPDETSQILQYANFVEKFTLYHSSQDRDLLRKILDSVNTENLQTFVYDGSFDLESSEILASFLSRAHRLVTFRTPFEEILEPELSNEDVLPIIKCILSPTLENISLPALTIASMEKLIEVLPVSNIRHFGFLCKCPDSNYTNSMIDLVRIFPKTKITCVDIKVLLPQVIIALTEILPQTKITKLTLEFASFGADGLHYLAKALKNTKINYVNIFRSEINNVTMKDLLTALPQTQVEYLNLFGHMLSEESLISLILTLPQTKLKLIDFSPLAIPKPQLDPEAAILLGDMFASCPPENIVKYLNLFGYTLSEESLINLIPKLPQTKEKEKLIDFSPLAIPKPQLDSEVAILLGDMFATGQLENIKVYHCETDQDVNRQLFDFVFEQKEGEIPEREHM